MTTSNLSAILPPDLLTAMFRARVPGTQSDPIDWTRLMPMTGSAAIKTPIFEALVKLSKLDLSNIVDVFLSDVLPAPESPAFPQQALGLLFLLDQGPRQFLRGIDQRWQVAVFDPLAASLARKLHALPHALRPYTQERWQTEQNWDVDHWVRVQLWFTAVFVHSEQAADHAVAVQLSEEMRVAVERATGTTDPHRATMAEDRKHPELFMRRIGEGPPQGDDVGMKEGMYWILNILWVHEPIIDIFGRYPYRNGIFGRPSTEAEVRFLEETEHFGEADEETVRRILEDVEAGRWTPLGSAQSSA